MTNQEVIRNHELDEGYRTDTHLHPEEMSIHTKEELTEDLQQDNTTALFIKKNLSEKGFSNIKSYRKYFTADKSNKGMIIGIRNEMEDKDILEIMELALNGEKEVCFADVNMEEKTLELDMKKED